MGGGRMSLCLGWMCRHGLRLLGGRIEMKTVVVMGLKVRLGGGLLDRILVYYCFYRLCTI